MARKPSALARELLKNFPKGKRRRGGRRRRKKGGGGAGADAEGADAVAVTEQQQPGVDETPGTDGDDAQDAPGEEQDAPGEPRDEPDEERDAA
jgi:hypothetical protein